MSNKTQTNNYLKVCFPILRAFLYSNYTSLMNGSIENLLAALHFNNCGIFISVSIYVTGSVPTEYTSHL